MKRFFAPLGVLSVLALFAAHASAAVTLISASGAAPSGDGWAVATTGGGPAGEFGGADPNLNGVTVASIVPGPPAWGLFAAVGSTVTASYSMGPLDPSAGPAFASIFFDNGTIPTVTPPSAVGVQFLGGGVLASEFLFVGGTPTWSYGDGTGFGIAAPTPFGFDGFKFDFVPVAPGFYDFLVGGVPVILGNPLAGGVSLVDEIRVVNFGAGTGGPDVIFNDLAFNIPEPSRAMLLMLGAVGLVARRRR